MCAAGWKEKRTVAFVIVTHNMVYGQFYTEAAAGSHRL